MVHDTSFKELLFIYPDFHGILKYYPFRECVFITMNRWRNIWSEPVSSKFQLISSKDLIFFDYFLVHNKLEQKSHRFTTKLASTYIWPLPLPAKLSIFVCLLTISHPEFTYRYHLVHGIHRVYFQLYIVPPIHHLINFYICCNVN